MKRRDFLNAMALAATLAFGAAGAGESDKPDHRPRKDMTDEERKAARERWENMSDEEKAKHRKSRQKRRKKRREKWENMSEEEREAAKEKMRERRRTQNEADGA